MPDLPTRLDYFNIGADEVLNRAQARPADQRISPSEVFTEGSDINIVIASSSAMADEATRYLAVSQEELFFDSAEGEALERLVADRLSPEIRKKQASPAVATLSFSRTQGTFPPETFDVGRTFKTDGGVEFELTAAVSLPLGATGPITGLAQAVIAGISGNVDQNTIVIFSQLPTDVNIQVTNPQVAAGGDSTESDPRFRARAKDFFRTARRGIRAAIEFGALTVRGVRQAVAIEELDSQGIPTGRVALYIADANGQANNALVQAVLGALLEYRGCGVYVDVVASLPVFVPIRYNLRFAAGIDSTLAFAQVQNAAVAAVNSLRPNQTLEVSLLTAVARSVPGVIVLDDAVVTPVGDLVPSAGQVIRTRPDLVTAV